MHMILTFCIISWNAEKPSERRKAVQMALALF